ncbi:DNA cytosine methyltransferase [Chryseobacterium luquanense]|uniref:DNA (cytosine-5-)-methyltransferase n=1 Tax=Chryseobacterium luquanense TaxID=2983766 RepID=A0ABT3Y3F5_9FLAO|nr:DNA cytosine methyltransferase [Chryseobacterium luquanense]MCX8532678.1 DNA cytosine methyltransferase [Chryseobacterium luquanense]
MKKLKVIDFFCGAGGFSEGFRQMGYEIIYGFDHWKPAVDTFNHNFNLSCEVKNILDFKNSIDEIENLPNTEIILGSPPCVSFSSSNKSGNADKSLGVELTETFLRIVAVKKHQPNSILKAWFMENVVNSKRYLQTAYTFKDLGLTEWANKNRISPLKIAINLYENSAIINSANYGSFQARKRVISGEIIKKGKLIIPTTTHSDGLDGKENYLTIGKMKKNFPNPFTKNSDKIITDPQYQLKILQNQLTDHFYDTGIYKVEWKFSKYWKTNHPFMGKMSFPENESKPSRTITATKIANSRESIIYKTELDRFGDGEFRLPTVREAAIIMGFPITYQFLGTDKNKWRLVGNAVCCSVSRAFAKIVLDEFKLTIPNNLVLNNKPYIDGVINLNTYKLRTFDKPPIKNHGSRFRRHTIKDGNLTVTLSNYDIENNSKSAEGKWFTSIQYGTGKGFPIQKINDKYYNNLEEIIKEYKGGKEFLKHINNGFSDKIGSSNELQKLYELQKSSTKYSEPTELVDSVKQLIDKLNLENVEIEQKKLRIFEHKDKVPLKQFFALYAINKISTIANGK